MNNRLAKFLAAENISQSQFADAVGVTRASVSHIISGRNKPGSDFIVSLMKNYPDLNVEWLLMGKGKMYKSKSLDGTAATLPTDAEFVADAQDIIEIPDSGEDIAADGTDRGAQASQSAEESPLPPRDENQGGEPRRIKKVIVFFDDGTFEEIR